MGDGGTRAMAGAILASVAVMLPACTAPPAANHAAATPAASAAAPPSAAPVLRQTKAEIARTIASLRQVDDHPLYELTFHGGYDREAPVAEAELARRDDAWACSLFYARGASGGGLFGRNFDWSANPALLVRADPPDGYASISLVDAYYALGDDRAPDLPDPVARRRLAHAVLTPFDGMNEKGLVIGMAQMPEDGAVPRRPGVRTVGSTRIMRIVLDKAATVDEAVALFRGYDVDFTGGPRLHYLVADAAGRSAVLEFAGGRLNVLRDERLLTNFTLTGTADRLADTRYRVLSQGRVAGTASAFDLLRRVAQHHTRWSVVYDQAAATARVVTSQRWDRVHTFPLREAG
jgi:Penicillin V acylase and related amidases